MEVYNKPFNESGVDMINITTIGLDIAPTVGALGEINLSFLCN